MGSHFLGSLVIPELNHLKSMYIRIIIVQDDGVVAIDFGPAFNARNNPRLTGDLSDFLDPSDEFGTNEAFVYKFISGL